MSVLEIINTQTIFFSFMPTKVFSGVVKYLVVHKINMTLKTSHHKTTRSVPYHQTTKTSAFIICNEKSFSLVSNSKCQKVYPEGDVRVKLEKTSTRRQKIEKFYYISLLCVYICSIIDAMKINSLTLTHILYWLSKALSHFYSLKYSPFHIIIVELFNTFKWIERINTLPVLQLYSKQPYIIGKMTNEFICRVYWLFGFITMLLDGVIRLKYRQSFDL